jgi:hypothetical protein
VGLRRINARCHALVICHCISVLKEVCDECWQLVHVVGLGFSDLCLMSSVPCCEIVTIVSKTLNWIIFCFPFDDYIS